MSLLQTVHCGTSTDRRNIGLMARSVGMRPQIPNRTPYMGVNHADTIWFHFTTKIEDRIYWSGNRTAAQNP
jgi:hypothetical protein